MPFRVSVIVVNFNTRDRLRACLAHITDVHEVIVIDNASVDGSAEMVQTEFPTVNLIQNSVNVGFGTANNQGLDAMTGQLALLLNSDALMSGDAIAELSFAFNDPEVIAAGPGQIRDDGQWQASAANQLTLWAVFCEQTYLERLLPFRPFSSYWIRPPRPGEQTPAMDVEQVMGASLMMRPGHRFDERFFLYCEDTELCFRLRKLGRIRYLPGVTCQHALGASSSQDRWRSVARYNRGKELYFAIHHGTTAAGAAWLMNRLGALLRLLVWGVMTVCTLGLVPSLRNQTGLFWRVLTAPLAGPARPHGTPPKPP